MTPERADKAGWFLLGVMAGGTALGTVLCHTETEALATSSALFAVWLVMFFVWLRWG